MKNVQKPEKIHLGKLIEEIKKGKYMIPDFQRDFEWGPWDVRDLIKSIFMDYYIGTLLLWTGSKHNFDVLSCTPVFGFSGDSDPEYIVLDGQQRLTAMHYAFFFPKVNFPKRKNPFYFFIRLNELLEENYDDAFFYYNATRYYTQIVESPKKQYANHLFPLNVLQGGTWGLGDWIKDYRDYWTERYEKYDEYFGANPEDSPSKEQVLEWSGNAKKLKELMEGLLNDYQVSYIELDKDIEVGKVCDIFTHINSRGIRLDIFDLLNAILRPKDIKLKHLWEQAKPRVKFIDEKRTKVNILQVMSILLQSYCSPQYLYYMVPGAIKTIKTPTGKKEIVLVDTEEKFTERWEEAVSTIEKTIQALKNPRDFGAITSKYLPYPSILPALSAIRRYVEKNNLPNKVDVHAKIRKWYWASIYLNRYSSSVESTAAKDFNDLRQWFQDDDKEPELIGDFVRAVKEIDLHREMKKGSAIYNAIFNLFILNEARDWNTFELPEYNSLDDHHIVPASWGRDNHTGGWINSILNKTPISKETNRNVIRNQLPNVYLKQMFEDNDEEKVYKVLSSHLISKEAVEILLREPFSNDDFNEFLMARRKTIIEAIEDKLINDVIELPPNLQILSDKVERIEIGLRDLINSVLERNSANPFREHVNPNIQQKVSDRVAREKKKHPGAPDNIFDSFREKLDFFDLMEYREVIAGKLSWPFFEAVFGNKNQLSTKFDQLAAIRNAIRHSRPLDEVARMEGEAALLWFQKILQKTLAN